MIKSRLNFLALTIGVLFLPACQLKPTKVVETTQLDVGLLVKNTQENFKLDPDMILVDARGAFEFSLSHPPGAFSLPWEELAQSTSPVPGRTRGDLEVVAKRLALLGLTPQSRVVVVGKGRAGAGEEGRVAWSLVHLGFKNVQIVGVDLFRRELTGASEPPRPNASPWVVRSLPQLEAQRSEILKAAAQVIREGAPRIHVIDVRSHKEYFRREGREGYSTPELRAINIPWPEFITEHGRPDRTLRKKLQAIGVGSTDRILTISNRGVRSGAAAFVLLSLGFTNVGNYTGGYTELLGAKVL